MSLHTKKLLKTTVLMISGLIINQLLVNHITITSNLNASALDYQSNPITLDFTFGSTLSITTGGDIVISELVPGTKSISDSNYKVIVSTNNTTGYTLAATVGCSSTSTGYGTNCVDNSNLVDSNNEDSSTNNFTMVAMNNGATTGTTLTPGTWGVSFDSTATEDSAFDALPLYSSPARIINQTINTTGTSAPMGGNPTTYYPGTNSTTMRIGAYATTSQLAGTYTNTINFIAVANTVPMLYMQDLTLSQCQVNVGTNGNAANIGDNITVVDRRDNNIYTVRYINWLCWMTQNLRITGTISSTDSNFDRVSSFNVSQYDLTDAEHCTRENASSDNPLGYTNVCSHFGKDDSGNPTAWYNYAAATTEQITGYSNSTIATQDICPSGWHLPSGPNTMEGSDINKLVGNTMSGSQDSTIGLVAFGAIVGGRYLNGELIHTDSGNWWSTAARAITSRYVIYFNGGTAQFIASDYVGRDTGRFIRCVKSE